MQNFIFVGFKENLKDMQGENLRNKILSDLKIKQER